MGRKPCREKQGLKKGAWSAWEDQILTQYIQTHGEGKWSDLTLKAGLKRCGKSCRLRWLNYLRPGIKRGNISAEEEDLILRLHKLLGNRWSLIAGRLPGRTDNEIKNYWNTNLSKRFSSSSSSHHDHQPSNNNNSKEFMSTVVMKSNIPVPSSQQCDHHHHEGQGQLIRTKAFKCTKIVIPPHLHDHHQTVDSNTSTDDQSPFSPAAAPPLKHEQENSSSAGFDNDMLMDFDINDLFISEDVLRETKLDDLLMDDRPLIQYQPNGDHHHHPDVDINALSSFLNSENDDDMITESLIN